MASKQQEKSEQTRKQLKESAYRLFLEKGYDGTTIAEITSSAGYATGSFYRHWKEKEQLFNLIQDEFIQNIKDLSRQAMEEIKSLEGTVDLLAHLFYELTVNRATLRLFVEGPQMMKNDQFLNKMNDIIRYFTEQLSRKMTELTGGSRPELAIHQLANLLCSFLSGYILLRSVEIEVPPIDTLKRALLVIVQADLQGAQ
jgi:AcrR family transcriptional regulator